MARLLSRALWFASRPPPPIAASLRRRTFRIPAVASSSLSSSSLFLFSTLPRDSRAMRPLGRSRATPFRAYRKVGRRPGVTKKKKKKKALELDVEICIEEELPEDPRILDIAETLQMDVAKAMKVAFDDLKDSDYKTRDNSIKDDDKFEKVELSLLLCNDDFIRKLNKDWRDEDHPTDVLSMSQHVPELDLPMLLLGDIVISTETAARQAEERGHTLLDEIRILMVHGLLHLLGFDHEISKEAEAEMEKEEEHILRSLGWTGKGLIKSACDAVTDEILQAGDFDKVTCNMKKEGTVDSHKPKLSYIFFDIDGISQDNEGQITTRSAEAMREAISMGVKIAVTTGKSRPAIIRALKMANFDGIDGIISELSPGVFLQGSLIYGRQGQEIYKANLDLDVCREAFLYSLEHKVPLVAFCQEQCLTLFGHPLVDSLHTIYHEPKAEIMPSIQQLLAYSSIQKLLFLDTAEGISSILRPYWSEATKKRASVIQVLPDMLEIIPCGTSKDSGVRMLLDHLGITSDENLPIGNGAMLASSIWTEAALQLK
ncbi:endoribonuclease YBEY, chloroplastic-like isoform X2 [Typha angustifolia]|uniref:endoribonuclease YBEY, chloroplastic-like isoform X2 n=1 Tax=Typha angustifolia TaxID=59011 RepID=UPI003C308482